MISVLLKQSPVNMALFSSIAIQVEKYVPPQPSFTQYEQQPQQQLQQQLSQKSPQLPHTPLPQPQLPPQPSQLPQQSPLPPQQVLPLKQPLLEGGSDVEDVDHVTIHGFSVVHYLLVKNKKWWNAEIFDFLFDMVTDHLKSAEKHVETLSGQKRHAKSSDATSSPSLLSNRQETLNLLLYCLMELDIQNNLSFVRSILGTFVEFLGESPRNLPVLRQHPYGMSALEANQASTNEGHQMGCGVLFIINLMIEIIGAAMIKDTTKTKGDRQSERSSAKVRS